MSESKRKGDALEQAAKLIEEMVIRSTEGVGHAPFSVEMNVRRTINDVAHEVDMLVTVNAGSPFETVHLYECKNWAKAVGKNEVIVLAEKIRAFGAARGVIIGRQFSESAHGQIKQAPNISLVHFTDNPWSDELTIACQSVSHRFSRRRVRIRSDDSFIVPSGLNWFGSPCVYRGESMLFIDFLDREIKACIHRIIPSWSGPGVFQDSMRPVLYFEPGELRVTEWNITTLGLDLEFETRVTNARLVSRFSIEKRGRFARFEFEKGTFDADSVAVEFLAAPDQGFSTQKRCSPEAF